MSTYNGRRGPNVSQYLRDLNSIDPQETREEPFNMEEDLALFTNSQFFDFDSGQNTDFQAHPAKVDIEVATAGTASNSGDVTAASSVIGDMPSLDFMSSDFSFPDFTNAYPAPSVNAFADGSPGFQPLPANHAPVYGNHVPQQHQAQFSPSSSRSSAEKRDIDSIPSGGSQMNFEDASRMAAEEDKRRRNTAASARFRVKKKQREQALEKSAKEMSDKVSSLESKVSQLETENKWLKNLLVEKNEGNDEITTMWKEFTKQASGKMNRSR